ncbi:MAG: 50S ribosomal protein L6 [Gammaproteobacteria bacterium]|jgi:large subunit ribosomal protein L6|nr:50S ribosomal protein L6 [Gammaproteobacteria bacterium]MBT4492548.1 50S ribosomal protein L6 [Gammaproteobacteria bacterium]MBT7370652.1 50S ribosomal protein L6 [Gammaproteobacteria bacterium]
MSRIANSPVQIPSGVEVNLSGKEISVKGAKGNLTLTVHELVEIKQEENELKLAATNSTKKSHALSGTFRSLISNMVMGVTEGFQKELELIGVGYRAQAQGKKLNLSLGFSHPVVYQAPEGIDIETPSQTQVIVKGIDKQLVGQVSAEIRDFRPPEPYKGKGVRYANEYVKRKEAKKK